MPTLRYVGQSHFREIGKADFTALGFDTPAVKVARYDIAPDQNWKNYGTDVDVTQDAADWLLENEPGDWEVTLEDDSEPDDEDADLTPAQARRAKKKQAADEKNPSPNASDAPSGSPESASVTTGGTSTTSSTRRA